MRTITQTMAKIPHSCDTFQVFISYFALIPSPSKQKSDHQFYPATNTWSYNSDLSKKYTSWCNEGTDLIRGANHLLIAFKAHSMRRHSYMISLTGPRA